MWLIRNASIVLRSTDRPNARQTHQWLPEAGHARPNLSLIFILVTVMFIAGGCHRATRSEGKSVQPPAEPRRGAANREAERVEVHVYEDEAMLRGTQAVIGGTIKNDSGATLESLSVELELQRRDRETIEHRKVSVAPSALAPGAQGRYQIALPVRDWSGARVLRVRSEMRDADIAFASSPGARRPPERPPQIRVNSSSPAPRQKPQGEEFINTPDNPSNIP